MNIELENTIERLEEEVNKQAKIIQWYEKENRHNQEIIIDLSKRIDKAIEYINKYETIKAYYEYIDEDGYDEYNCDEDFKKELLDILKEVKTC